MTLSIWPVQNGSLSFIDVGVDAGSDMTFWVDYGTEDIEERFVLLKEDLTPYNYTYPDVGTYTVTVHLSNSKSYASLTAYAEVDFNVTDLQIQTEHTEYGTPTWMNVSATAGTRITVFWIIDNGYAKENYATNYSTIMDLDYTVTDKGFYEMELRVSNSLFYSYQTYLIAVVDRITNFVLAVPIVQNHTVAVDWVRTLDAGSNMTCLLDYGDGNLTLLHEQVPQTSYTFSHTYLDIGVYFWNLHCSNLLNTIVESGNVTIQVPITNLQTSQNVLFLFGGDLKLEWDIDAGTNLTFEVTFNLANNSQELVPTNQITYSYGDLDGHVAFDEANYTAGDWVAVIKGSNLVSSAEKTVSITIDRFIRNLTLVPDLFFQQPNQPISFTTDMTDGSRAEQYIDWGDGTPPHVSAAPSTSLSGPDPYQVTKSYLSPGYYIVTATVNNSVSFSVRTIEIGIEYPVDNYTLTYSNETRPENNVSITLHHPVDKATSALVLIDYGHDENRSTEDLNVITDHVTEHYFPYYQVYEVNVTLMNNLSTITFIEYIMVGVYILGEAIDVPDSNTNYCVPPSPPVGIGLPTIQAMFTLSIDQGSNAEYKLDPGDGSDTSWIPRPGITNWLNADQVIVPHTYTAPGDYTVKMTVKNNFTIPPNHIEVVWGVINVETPVAGFTWEALPTQVLNATSNSTFTLAQNTSFNFPTDAICYFLYDDGNNETVPMTETGGPQKFIHSHLYDIPHGPREPTINCSNCVSSVLYNQSLIFQRAIYLLNLRSSNYTVEVDQPADLLVYNLYGSHINVSIDFSGTGTWDQSYYYIDPPFIGQENETTYTHIFPDEGNFTCKVRMFNDISSVTANCPSKYIIQYSMAELILYSESPYKMVAPESNVTVFVKLGPNVINPPTDPFCIWTYYSGAMSKTTYARPIYERKIFNDTHLYSFDHVGTVTITCKCTNYIQYVFLFMTIVIQERVYGLNVTLSPLTFEPHFYFNTSVVVAFEILCRNGSHAEAKLNYGDGSAIDRQDMADPFAGFTNSRNIEFRHRFSQPGNVTPGLIVNNTVSSLNVVFGVPLLPVLVIQDHLPNITAVISNYYLPTPPGEVPFTITLSSDPPLPGPTDPYITSTIVMTDANQTLESFYSAKSEFDTNGQDMVAGTSFSGLELLPSGVIGQGTWQVNVSNLVSYRYRVVPFRIEHVISGLHSYTNESVLRINQVFTLNINVENGSHIEFHINLGEPNENDVILDHPEQLNSTHLFQYIHHYPVGGNYTITVLAINHVSNDTTEANTTQIVMAPLRHLDFRVVNLNSLDKIPSSPGIVNFSLCITDEDMGDRVVWPHNVFMNWTIDDASATATHYFDFQSSEDGCYFYAHTLQEYRHGNLGTVVDCWNAVSNLTISIRVDVIQITENPVIQSSHDAQAVDQPVDLTCSCGKGSNITIVIDYDDGSDKEEFFFPGTIDSATVNFTHAYTVPNNYSASCNFTNDVSSNITYLYPPLVIQHPIVEGRTELESSSPYIRSPPGLVQWTISISEPPSPTDVHISNDDLFLFSTEFPFQFNTTDNVTGATNLTFNLRNLISDVTITRLLTFQQPISGVLIDSVEYVAVGTNATFVCSRDSGTHSFITMTLDIKLPPVYQLGYSKDTYFTRIFDEAGTYTPTCRICNNVTSCQEHSASSVSALNSATSILFQHNRIVNIEKNTGIVLKIDDESKPTTRGNVTLVYGDNSNETRQYISDPFTSTSFEHEFPRVGIFYMKAYLENEVSAVSNESVIDVRRPITNLTIIVKVETEIRSDTTDISKDSIVTVEAYFQQGTNVSFNWTLISPSDEIEYLSSDPSTSVPSSEAGVFKVRLDAQNVISYAYALKEITIKNDLEIKTFNCPGARTGLQVNKLETCEVELVEALEHLCFIVRFTSNKTMNIPPLVFGTSSEECPPDAAAEDSFTEIEGPTATLAFNFSISQQVDPLFINLSVSSQGSSDADFEKTTVRLKPCAKPEVSAKAGEGEFDSNPKIFLKSEPKFTIRHTSLNTFVSCLADHVRSDVWKIYSFNPNATYSDPILEETNSSKIKIENDLPYGVYFALYTIALHLNSGPDLLGSGIYYFQIAPTDLKVQFEQGSFLQIGKSERIDLTADVSDPDGEDAPLILTWSCHKKESEAEGCFEDGFLELIEGITEASLRIEGPRLTIEGPWSTDYEYVFVIRAEKGSRSKEGEITVKAVDGVPPKLGSTCKICEGRLNYKKTYVFCAVCDDCNGNELTWEVKCGGSELEIETVDDICAKVKLKGCINQCLTIRITLKKPGLPEAVKGLQYNTADKPHGGSCQVKPKNGKALQTKFSIECSSWIDRSDTDDPCSDNPQAAKRRRRSTANSQGLSFSFFYRMAEGESEVPIPTSTPQFPSGSEANGFAITVIIRIRNKYDIESQVNLTVVVTPPPDGAVTNAVDGFIPSGNPADDFASLAAMASMVSSGSTPGSSVPGEEENEAEDNGVLLAKIVNNMASILDNDPDPDTLMAMMTMVSAATKKKVPGVVTASQETISLMLKISSNIKTLEPDAIGEFGTNLLGTIGQEAADIDSVPPPEPTPEPDLEAVPDEEAEEREAEERRLAEIERRNSQIQVATSMQKSTQNMVASITKTLIENQTITVGHEDLQVTVVLKKIENLAGSMIGTPGGNITIPAMNFINESGDTLVIFDVTFSKTNIFSWSDSASQVSSGITMMDLRTDKGDPVPFGELQEPMELSMKQDGGKDNFADMANATIDPLSNLIYLYVPVVDSAGAYVMEVSVDDFETSENLYFDVYVKFNATNGNIAHRPNATKGTYDWNATVPDTQRWYAWILVIPEKLVGPPGLYIGFLPKIRDDPTPVNTTPTFEMASAFTRCRSWNHLDEEWTKESCEVDGIRTTLTDTLCSCNKLNHDVKTFSAGITMPAVNPIDFSNIFANFAELLNANPTVLATLISIFVIYILLLVWARQKDKKDTERWGVTPLVDNLPDSSLFYKVSVYTGLRQKAGTQSKVCFILAGEKGDTGVRVMDDGRGKHFIRGSVRHFVMSLNDDLGPLNYVRIWHDNSGEGVTASWFLDKIMIEDLQRKTRYFFLCSRWLAADEEDGQVDRSLPVAGDEEIDGFDHIFFSSARHNLTDDHLWISVLSRPTKSSFTRAQRLTCCLTLLYTTMIVNAMFYRQPGAEQGQDQVVRIGPIVLSIQTLLISIYASLIVVPINVLIVQLFRKSKPRYYVDIEEAKKAKEMQTRRRNYMSENIGQKQLKEIIEGGEKKDPKKSTEKPKKKKRFTIGKYPLPWWCIYIGWAISFIACAVSAFFVLMYSLQWGKLLSEQWLSSLLFSFVESVIVIQPIKVIAVAMILSCIFKKYQDENDNEDDLAMAKLQDDEEPIDVNFTDLNTLTAPAPPSSKELKEAREKAAKDKHMWNTLKEALVYLLFLILVAFIAWGPRDSNMYGMVTSIKHQVAGEYKKYGPNAYETMDNLGDGFRFWLWVNTTVTDALFNTRRYNGDLTTRRERKYISDGVSFRVGPVRLRQLRIKPAECLVAAVIRPFIIECNVNYNIATEEDRNYTAGWVPDTGNSTYNPESIDKAFRYHSMMDLNGFPLFGHMATFGGGGYVADLSTSPRRARRIIQNLIATNWVDYYTRAVFLEFTIYNPNINLFSHTSFLVEFPLTGATLPMHKTRGFHVYSGVGAMGTAVLVAQITYILVMVYFIYREIKELREKGKMKYFADPWNVYEVIVIIASIVCIAMFAMKEVFGRLVTKQLKDDKDGYSSYLQLATYIELVDYTIGFIVFMANIKFLRLLRFNTHVRELSKTFYVAGRELLYFAASFFIVYSAFTLSATLLFGSSMYDFAHYIKSLQALYAIILGSTDLNSMRRAQPYLGPAFFFVYLTMVFFILVNMFVTILTTAYTTVRLAAKEEEDEVLPFFMSRFKNAVGMAKPDRDIGAGYIEPADLLDRRIDSLNAWINQYYREEANAKKAAKKGKDSRPKEKPLEGEESSRKSGWSSMFTF